MSNIPYTLTEYQTELQTRLNAVSGSTTNKQLIILGRALELNAGLTTTTYATEVQSRLTATDGATTDKELLELAVLIGKIDNDIFDQVPVSTGDLATSAELTALASTVGIKNYLAFTTTDTFLVPAGVFEIPFKATGGGGNGGNGSASGGGGGGSAGCTVYGLLYVQPGQTLNLTIGAAGGGDTSIDDGTYTLVLAAGGNSGVTTSIGAVPTTAVFNHSFSVVIPNQGSAGNNATNGSPGLVPRAFTLNNASPLGDIVGFPVSAGGTGNGTQGGGGGGSSSIYGAGGDGGNGDATTATAGSSPAATAYGAGGGGGGEGGAHGAGGAGIGGIVEIWY